ncbi:ComEA family DNA-binding protein [Ramlibacter sp. MMS24-I3-19]|uniref:ComEA family DNA-binding protein n=1 Tax=Ramlibacter sp. MMS24-I3-19 TaxID=3416606 RepID=UPI003CFD34FD
MFKKILAILAFLMSAAVAMAAVDANKASEAELDSVKGIGPGTSKQIVTERKKGDFKSWDDFIARVKGVGEKRATNLSDAGLTVGGKPYTHTTAATKADDKNAKADTKAESKAAKTEAKADAKAMKAEAKADKESAKAGAKAEKAKIDAKEAKAEAAADAKADKANAKK